MPPRLRLPKRSRGFLSRCCYFLDLSRSTIRAASTSRWLTVPTRFRTPSEHRITLEFRSPLQSSGEKLMFDFSRPNFCDHRAASGCGPRPIMVGWPFVTMAPSIKPSVDLANSSWTSTKPFSLDLRFNSTNTFHPRISSKMSSARQMRHNNLVTIICSTSGRHSPSACACDL